MSTPKRNTSKKRVVTGSGMAKGSRFFSTWNKLHFVTAGIFAVTFIAVGVYLLRSSFAYSATTVTVASWNAMKDNKKDTAVQTKAILKKANVVGLQEVHSAGQRNAIQKLIESSKYAVSPKATKNNTSAEGVASYAIVWREKEFRRVSEGASGKVASGLDGLRARYITWVKLEQRVTGKQFYVINTHMVRDVDNGGALSKKTANIKAYKSHMDKLVSLTKKLQKDNVPIFITGDFAMDYRKDTGTVSIFPKAALGAVGVKSNWELTNMQGVASKAKTYGSGARLIDYVFAWNVEPISTSIAKSRQGSDHYAVYFTADLVPSSAVDTR